jgi:hypothetical protein
MKVSELIDILKQCESSEDVVIVSNLYPDFTSRTGWRPDNYFQFKVTEHRAQLGAKGSSTIGALEMTDTIVGYFKSFIKLKK